MMRKGNNTTFAFSLLFFALLPSLVSGTLIYWASTHINLLSHLDIKGAILYFMVTGLLMGLALTPTTVVAILSGYLFHWPGFTGVFLSYAGAVFLGTYTGKWLQHLGIRPDIEKSEKLGLLLKRLDSRQFIFVFLTRLSPVLPFAMTNLALSNMKIHWRAYLLGSLIGMLPRTITFFWAGMQAENIWEFVRHPSFTGAFQFLPLILIGVSVGGMILLFRRLTRKDS